MEFELRITIEIELVPARYQRTRECVDPAGLGSVGLPFGGFVRCEAPTPWDTPECVDVPPDDPQPNIEPRELDALIEQERAAGEQVHEDRSCLAADMLANPGYFHVYYDGVRLVLIG